MAKTDKEKLRLWQDRFSRALDEYSPELKKMEEWERLYNGSNKIKPMIDGSEIIKTPHVRNICAEIIEAEVDNSIPKPKVSPWEKADEGKAEVTEYMILNEIDRLPFERLNDQSERLVPVYGGVGFLLEWDSTAKTHTTSGELCVTLLHPKMVIPQDGVTDIKDMDYIFLRLPQTKAYIKSRYGVDVSEEGEQDPDIRVSQSDSPADDMVTQYVAYYRNENGGIGIYSWVNDTQIEDLEDYQARHLRHCAVCGVKEPPEGEDLEASSMPTIDGTIPPEGEKKHSKGVCQYCGSNKWTSESEDMEEIYYPVMRSDGSMIPGAQLVAEDTGELDEAGLPIQTIQQVPTRVPYYKPDVFPVVIQRNISSYGHFLGESDVERISTHQNTINRLEAKIIDKLCSTGSYLTLPDDASIEVNDKEMKIIYPGSPAARDMISVINVEGNISQDLTYLQQVYEEAKQIIGITDSYLGRKDTTASSGKAKEFAASQSAGRLESKKIAKNAMYADLFEAMFKFKLAYADEPRPVTSTDTKGKRSYAEFNRYDFLQQDENGEWYWNDRFLFSCDNASALGVNREAMWQETRDMMQAGLFGNPTETETLVLYWTKMELLHYPGASQTKAYLEDKLQREREIQLQQMKVEQAKNGLERATSGNPMMADRNMM